MIKGLILVLALLAATSSRANVLTVVDAQRVQDLAQKALSIETDVGVVERSASSASTRRCLKELKKNLLEFLAEIAPVADLVAVVSQMVDPMDEVVVASYLRIETQNFLKYLTVDRNEIIGIMGECLSSRAVAVKAQDILRLYDEAKSLVGVMSKKIGTEASQ